MRRLLSSLVLLSVTMLVLAPAALAANDGRGLYGETTDKVVTNAGFLVIAFFPLLVFVLSMVQWRLDKRKAARKAAAQRRIHEPHWRGGW